MDATQAGIGGPLAARRSLPLDRETLFVGCFAVGLANGLGARLIEAVARDGLAGAVLDTFGISVIVWAGAAIAVSFMLREALGEASRRDLAAAGMALAAFLVPLPPLSWVALSLLAAYAGLTSPRGSFARRGAWIMLALTVPMFWSRMLFQAFGDLILRCDAALVGWLVGTSRVGNAIAFADGSGYLWIAPGCSSLANMSLAVLCSVIATQYAGARLSPRALAWGAAACAAVLAVNVARLTLIGLYSGHYDLIHGPVGATAANWITFGVTVAICWLGVRRDLARL